MKDVGKVFMDCIEQTKLSAKKEVFDDIENMLLETPIKDKMSMINRLTDAIEEVKKKHLGEK